MEAVEETTSSSEEEDEKVAEEEDVLPESTEMVKKRKREEQEKGYVYVFSYAMYTYYGENVHNIGHSKEPEKTCTQSVRRFSFVP